MEEERASSDAPVNEEGVDANAGQSQGDDEVGRTTEDGTTINPEDVAPIDPEMPEMPPA